MTAITLANIPSSINTYERLLVWAAMCCQSISNGGRTNVVAGANQQETVAVQVYATADNVKRFVVSAYVPVDYDALNSSTAKAWMAALDISTATPHTNLLSN